MKKIGIFTIQSLNYGNRLQNYASQEILKKLGYKVLTFRQDRPVNIKKRAMKDWIRNLLKKDRYALFCEFNKRISYSKDYITSNHYNVKTKKYHAILAGSDQIWNTEFHFVTSNYFLPFIHPKKIAWSASFGVDEIENGKEIARYLADFKSISVREDVGAKIVKTLIGKDAEVILDPTMLLNAEEWKQISRKPKGIKEGSYILTYFLSPKCKAAEDKLQELKSERNVYELLNKNDVIANNTGPSEFLYLFENASMILTDSFHACVFSFLFDKPFIVYDRNWEDSNMNSRLQTLLSKFKLERKYAESGLENDVWEHNYTEGYDILETERKKTLDFLNKSLQE